jgi:acyl-CoA synthetase (AMP-forming)/AMP-acid ligase II
MSCKLQVFACSVAMYGPDSPSTVGSLGTVATPAEEVTVTAISMAHMFGINMLLTHSLLLGFRLIVMKKFDVKNYLLLVEKHRVISRFEQADI